MKNIADRAIKPDSTPASSDQQYDATDLIRRRYNNRDSVEGLSDVDSVNDTKSLHNRRKFTSKGDHIDIDNTSQTSQAQINNFESFMKFAMTNDQANLAAPQPQDAHKLMDMFNKFQQYQNMQTDTNNSSIPNILQNVTEGGNSSVDNGATSRMLTNEPLTKRVKVN